MAQASVLHLISFILYQNSFQLAFCTWTSRSDSASDHVFIKKLSIYHKGGYGCFCPNTHVTLPLYALVTQITCNMYQMGTSMNKVVFTENVIRDIQIWQDKAKNKDLRIHIHKAQILGTSRSFRLHGSVSISMRTTRITDSRTKARFISRILPAKYRKARAFSLNIYKLQFLEL